MRLSILLLLALAGSAHADPIKLLVTNGPAHKNVPREVLQNQQIYLNDCGTPCQVKVGADDATTDTSEAPRNNATFNRYAWQTGEWAQVVQCVKEVYSPYNVQITDVRPVGQQYNEIIVAGDPTAVGLDAGTGGVVAHEFCGGATNEIAFAFAETAVDIFAHEDNNNRIWGICWVIAQETAHLYGLDHEYSWTDDQSSACNDPMTYRADCGGQKFFRNRSANCGEFGPPHGCMCNNPQNSHQLLLNVLGPGTPITAPPVVMLTSPADGATVQNGQAVIAHASSQRGIGHVELWLNGYKWATAKGNGWGASGQPAADYNMMMPANVPDGVIDIVVKAFDDLLIETDTPMITVTKGAPCATADTCLKGQKCEAGKCFWDAPTGALGDHCDYDQFCTSGTCTQTDQGNYCTSDCIVGTSDSCVMGFECIATTASQGVCLPVGRANNTCCSASPDSRSWAAHAGVSLGVLAIVMRRRRRRGPRGCAGE